MEDFKINVHYYRMKLEFIHRHSFHRSQAQVLSSTSNWHHDNLREPRDPFKYLRISRRIRRIQLEFSVWEQLQKLKQHTDFSKRWQSVFPCKPCCC